MIWLSLPFTNTFKFVATNITYFRPPVFDNNFGLLVSIVYGGDDGVLHFPLFPKRTFWQALWDHKDRSVIINHYSPHQFCEPIQMGCIIQQRDIILWVLDIFFNLVLRQRRRINYHRNLYTRKQTTVTMLKVIYIILLKPRERMTSSIFPARKVNIFVWNYKWYREFAAENHVFDIFDYNTGLITAVNLKDDVLYQTHALVGNVFKIKTTPPITVSYY